MSGKYGQQAGGICRLAQFETMDVRIMVLAKIVAMRVPGNPTATANQLMRPGISFSFSPPIWW
jgi:hypothetical protein